ncbi:MAG: putative metal-binding motif-containing protein [Deltaproteobacteria bacterium]|nr:putative metal-binding motif-containing protein [Deltaproteobacteria bacterium]
MTCLSCHRTLGRDLRVSVAILDAQDNAAVMPLSPASTYTVRVRAHWFPGGNGTTPFEAGFNLAAGDAARPTTSGKFTVPAAEAAWVRVSGAEATHAVKRPSALAAGRHQVTWTALWQPPVLPAGADGNLRVFASVRRARGEMRPLSAVSDTPNTANATECGTTAGGPAACGVPVTVTTTNCVDADGDGYVSQTGCAFTDPLQGTGDCDDADPAIHPGAAERCNQRDDNCDGAADEGTRLRRYYSDADGDQWGDLQATGVVVCDVASALAAGLVNPVTNGLDCDDADPDTHPSAPELCDDKDQDCDTLPVNGLTWNGLEHGAPCDSPLDDDSCARGHVACGTLTELTCAGDTPSPERCDGADHDDNCDGRSDSAAFPELGRVCDPGVDAGRCNVSLYACSVDGTGLRCDTRPFTPGAAEVCGNGADDDCDGDVDETEGLTWQGLAFGQACDAPVDADYCGMGVVACADFLPACVGDVATPEQCADTLDNDCDGETDEADCERVDAGVPSDAGASAPDAAVLPADAGAPAVDGGPGPETEASPPGRRCACATARGGVPPWLLLLALASRRRPQTPSPPAV